MVKHKELVFLIFLAVIVFGIYARTLTYEPVWDDREFLRADSPFFTNHKIWEAFRLGYFIEPKDTSARFFYYRPLVTASFMLERALWGLRPWSMRLVNLVLYVLGLFALYAFLRRQSEKTFFAEITTLLFALNPLNADNVVWIVGRCDLLLLLWGGLALVSLARNAERPGKGYWVLSSAAFALGIFSKESFVFFFPALIVYELVRGKRLTLAYHLTNLAITVGFFILKNRVLGIGNPALNFLPGLGKNIVKLVAAAGYYARSLVFPILYDRFLPDAELAKPVYLVFGIAFGLATLGLVYLATRRKAVAVPVALLAGFVAGSLGLVFARFVSYHLYARYMMIPAFGATWLLIHALRRLKDWHRNVIAFAILLLFIPSVVLRGYDYRTNVAFFQKAARDFPEEGFLAYELATAYHEKEDYLNTELALQKALSKPLDVKIVAGGRLLMAEIEFWRADYPKSLRWVESLAGFPPEAFTLLLRYQETHQKGLIAQAQGDADAAERRFRENIAFLPNLVDSYRELAHLYLGREEWEKAENVERQMRARFGEAVTLDAAKLQSEFETMAQADKADFYFRHRNYGRAVEVLAGLPSRTMEQEIGLVRLYFRAGREAEAREAAFRIVRDYPSDIKARNALGMLYLRDFLRVEDALACFKESFALDRNQPEVAALVVQLTGYLQAAQPILPPFR
jgi:tetratricopeptide (TPR) repeat protein